MSPKRQTEDDGKTEVDGSGTDNKRRRVPKPYLADDISDEASGSGSSPPFPGYEHEVFLSFRGSDTRQGFTDCLYHTLKGAGVRTFRDDESLRTGEEIGTNLVRAIAESKIYIPVFSKDYASSKWCLKELTLMLKYNKEREHMILPVFYDVTPSEVQDQTGDYGRALQKHHKKYGPEVVSSWEETLRKVGHLKGMDLVKLANGYHGKFIELIVSKVLSELKKSQLVVTDKLIGIDEHVQAITQLLQFDASEVRIIGIWGMGGIGKTTLAKVIYNQILDSFECYSFIKDVRETSRCNGLPYLQSSLVADLSRRELPPFKSVDEGINALKHRYCHKKVFIVVDDIDDTAQLGALVIKRDSFGPGSRILITTRNRNILDSVGGVNCIYEAKAMSEGNALKLFYKHSLGRDSPTDELTDLSIEIVRSTGGLPLAVEVIGSFLYGKSVLIWKDTLEKLRNLPNKEVRNKLLVCIDALDHEEKQIFLDIACFFIGEDISKMFFVWEDCKLSPKIGIDVLVACSFIKIVDKNKIWMHNLLRDLGREIVYRENYMNPGMRSRLWHTEEVKAILANQMHVSSNVEAIRLHLCELYRNDKAIRIPGTSSGEEKHIFTSEQFRKHSNLRFLDLKSVHFAGDITIPSLRWLRWTRSSLDSLINLHMPNLVSLELGKTNLSHDWNGWASIQMMRLKALDLNGSANLTKIPTFSGFPSLERLTLSDCSKLEVIDSSIGELQNLTYLDITNCFSIKRLPDLSKLQKLEVFCADYCYKLQELIGVDEVKSLKKLQIANCWVIEKLPNLSKLKQLEELFADYCGKLQEIVGIDDLNALKVIGLQWCEQLKKLPDLSKLDRLEILNISGCEKLQELIGLDHLCSLERLDITHLYSIKRLPDLSKLQKLEEFCADYCYKLQELIGIDEVKSLKKLHIANCQAIEMLPNLSKLKQLEELFCDYCGKLQEIEGISDLNALKVISLRMCKQLRKLSDLTKLNRLEMLNLSGCEKLQELIGLDQLCSLERVDITMPKPYLADDVIDESEGSGSSPPFPGYEYEVFLSFRGPDTRQGFTDFLYHALLDGGVRTFRDDESLRTGEEIGTNIGRSIADSKIYIPVFSKNYASSKWCLEELTLMLKVNKDREHMILPVFYDVTPAEVQDQIGDYGRALQKHHDKYGPEVVSSWKEALCKVGHLKGMDLVKLANGYQGQFIKLIVSKVLSELKKCQLVVTEKLIGIGEHVEAIRQLLQFDASQVRIIGIWGMGGIGKTTLAKVIYNQILHSFQCYSFIQDVRETSRCNGLPHLQRSLVADLSRREPPPFNSVDEGINELKHRHCHKKVLIVVDDIDDPVQLDALVIRRDSFGPGSRILVTTRNKHILDRVEVDCIYEAKSMSEDNALKLFYKYSIRKDSPTDELTDISIKIVRSTGGLPLAVEVIGSLLYGKSMLIWKKTLEKLRILPNEEVLDKLLVSFEALDHEQKQIFLDIACFFIGEDISKMFFMWEDCKFFPEIGIDVLVAHSLVKIVDKNKIWMHDQVRDLGREIVRRENYTNPGMRSRLWHTKEVKAILANQMHASSNVEAIRLHLSELYRNVVPPVGIARWAKASLCMELGSSQDKAIHISGTSSVEEKHIFTTEQFREHSNLRFLDLERVHLAGDITIPSLRWLRWAHSSVDSSINLHLSNLVSLELVNTNLSHDWNGWASIQMMRLKVLDLNGSANLTKTPIFSGFPNLERLTLSHCSKLEVIDSSIGELQNLTYLDINSCDRVRELPHELISLKKLEFLDSSGCGELTGIPSSIIGHLLKLQTLNLRDCRKLETFLALLDHLYNQQVHKYIDLIILDISGCQNVTTLPNLSILKSLKTLNASNCIKLEGLVGLDQLCSLESLNIGGCSSIERLPDLSKLQNLEVFCARNCYKLQELVGIDEAKSLKQLQITCCKEIEKLPNLSKLKQLEELFADGCEKLQEIVGFGDLNTLKVINLERCKQLRKLPDLSKLNRLEALNLLGCEKLEDLIGLDQLCSLEILDINDCYSIKKLSDLSKLQNLEVFCARDCYNLQELVGIDEVKSLKKLRITKCEKIEKLPNLSKLKKLEELSANGCEKLREIVGFGNLNALKVISLKMCKHLRKLPNLSKLNCLEALDLFGCAMLEELIGLDQLCSLARLDIRNCYSIKRLPDLSKLQKLKVFCDDDEEEKEEDKKFYPFF